MSSKNITNTPVPTSGHIEKLYFNTNLTNEEITSIFKNAKTYMYKGSIGYFVMNGTEDDQNVLVVIEYGVNEETNLSAGAIAYVDNNQGIEQYLCIFGDNTAALSGMPFTGWNPDFNGILELNIENNLSILTTGAYNYDKEGFNNALSGLVSMTPVFDTPEDKPLQFKETNINLDIYENLTAKDYEALEKKEHALYIVKDVGIYKGTKLIARNEDVTKLGLEKVLNLYIRNESVTDITNLTDAIIHFNDTINFSSSYSWEINFNTINNYNDEGY